MPTFVGMTNQEMACRDASFRRDPPDVLNSYKIQSKLR